MMKSIIITALLACMAVPAFAGDQIACPAASTLLEQSGEPHLWVNKVFQMQHFKAKRWLRFHHSVTFIGAEVHYFAHAKQQTRALICYYSDHDQRGQQAMLAYRAGGLNIAPLSSVWRQGDHNVYVCASKQEAHCNVTLSTDSPDRALPK